MELTTGYLAGPGRCGCCGSSDSSQPIVDLQVYDPGVMNRRLRMYLCGACALQAGQLVCERQGMAFVARDELEAVESLYQRAVAAEARAGDAEAKLALIGETYVAVSG